MGHDKVKILIQRELSSQYEVTTYVPRTLTEEDISLAYKYIPDVKIIEGLLSQFPIHYSGASSLTKEIFKSLFNQSILVGDLGACLFLVENPSDDNTDIKLMKSFITIDELDFYCILYKKVRDLPYLAPHRLCYTVHIYSRIKELYKEYCSQAIRLAQAERISSVQKSMS